MVDRPNATPVVSGLLVKHLSNCYSLKIYRKCDLQSYLSLRFQFLRSISTKIAAVYQLLPSLPLLAIVHANFSLKVKAKF